MVVRFTTTYAISVYLH